MYTYPNTTQQITRKSTTTTKTYDEQGRLIIEETYEEIEYAPQPATLPNQPWIITNAANTQYTDVDRGYVEDMQGGYPK